jgi:dual-specificity kinase
VRNHYISHCAMSTPSTLPPHHPNYGYSHHQNYQSTNGYRVNNNLLNGGSRLGASYNFPTPSSNGTSSNSIGTADPPPTPKAAHSSRPETKTAAMPASASAAANKQNPKKRQRSREPREPDWHKFYENGLPKEVIVIDDSPTPEPSASVVSNTQAARSIAGGNSRHAAKKRKRDDVGSAYDPVYHLGHSNNPTPEYKDSASGSTISTDRTTSAIHTTAATSLGSHSSNGQNGYEVTEVQPGQKRKRTATRLQIANEAKRKELEVNGDAYTNYKPPPRPPIKAPDVQVKQVTDVSD